MSLDLTIVIPVKNEAANLPACLNAIGVGFARRVVVVDSASTDDSLRIAREGGAECVSFAWDGRFPKKRNWFLRNHKPDTTWVLFLDADECLTPEFKGELAATLTGEHIFNAMRILLETFPKNAWTSEIMIERARTTGNGGN